MTARLLRRLPHAALLVALFSTIGIAQAAPFKDHLVQAPQLSGPERGSVAGTLSGFAFEPGSLSRGDFSLPAQMSAPTERGPLLVNVFPTYAPDAGQSEWGMGWRVDLAIQRSAVVGDIDFTGQEFTSPWGRLVKGTDDWFFPIGFMAQVALERTGDGGWRAVTGDGAVYTFAGTDMMGAQYAWMLSRVDTVVGDSTVLTYERNATGRPFVKTVEWGGRGIARQYRLELAYEPLLEEVEDYRSGARIALDRRVREVRVLVRSAASGTFEPRWTFSLDHTTSTVGPAFYLVGVTKSYRSGASEPTQRYEYDLGTETLTSAVLADVPQLDNVIAKWGPGVLQPDKSIAIDLEEDGWLDLEIAKDQWVARRHATGYSLEALPTAPGMSPFCRSETHTLNLPRRLARMTPAAAEPQVFRSFQVGSSNNTRMLICNRQGVPVWDQTVPGFWGLGPNTHLVDVNRDRRPDIVRVFTNGYQVLENQSGPDGYKFVAHPTGPLAPSGQPEASWLHDMNGDGQADIVARYSAGISVWYGLGQLKFMKDARALPLRSGSSPVLDIAQRELSFVDVNRDGLTDLLTTKAKSVTLFLNTGRKLQEAVIPGLGGGVLNWEFGSAAVTDISGEGNVEVAFVKGPRAKSIQLTTPGTGLMRALHDGQGTHVELHYERAAAAPGLGHRPPLLAELTVASSGQDPVSTQFEYAQPVMHTKGKFLVGYGTTRRISPFVMEEVNFHHDDEISGRVLETLATDALSSIYRYSHVDFEEASYLGLRVLRERTNTHGVRSFDGTETLAQTSEVLAYERGLCPTLTRATNTHGEVETENALATISGLETRLHCLPSSQRIRGTHSESSLNFEYMATLMRSETGQVTQLLQLGADGLQTLQSIGYDASHRVTTIASPGDGTTTFAYSSTTGLLSSIVDPAAVATRTISTDPISDALHEMAMDHGPGGVLTASFRFDGHERLWKTWDDLGAATEAAPEMSLEYAYARDDGPSVVRSRELVAPGIERETALLATAAGQAVATMSRGPSGWLVGTVVRADPNAREVTTSYRAPMSGGNPWDVTWTQVMAGAQPLGVERLAGFGHSIYSSSAVQAGVDRVLAHGVVLENGTLVTTEIENETFVTSVATDLAGLALWTVDPSGQTTRMRYDALGRLRRVELPDGSVHRLSLDSYGRPSEVQRVDLATVRYAYDENTGLMREKAVLDGEGNLERTLTWARDSAGRIVTETHRKASTGQTRTFRYRYDGNVPGETQVPGQIGYLTEVRGDGFSKRATFNRDGARSHHRVRLDGFRDVVEESTFYEDGTPKDVTTIVRDDVGNELYRLTQTDVYDAFGRLAEVRIDGQRFATSIYDDEGKVERLDFADGRTIANHYDPRTRQLSGYWQDGGGWNGGVDWTLDARGKVASEAISFGAESWTRTYGYESRGFLTSAKDQDQDSRYEYAAASGRPKRITDVAGDRLFVSVGRHTQVGTLHYQRDAMGRVVERGDLALEYGPTGDVEVARRGARAWNFTYDERDQRLIKREGGLVRAAYVGGMYLESQRLVMPVRLGGRVVGVFELTALGKTFEPLATDPRGTLLGEGGVPNLPTPYGVRDTRPELAPAVDFVEKGFDADLGTVRMGVRDYDPYAGQFLTPDPLFMEQIELVASRPVSGNLFSYASNDPVGRIDPTGTFDDPGQFYTAARTAAPAAPVVVGAGAAAIGTWGAGTVIAATGVIGVGVVVGVLVYRHYRTPTPKLMDPIPVGDGRPEIQYQTPRESPRLDVRPDTRTKPPDDDERELPYTIRLQAQGKDGVEKSVIIAGRAPISGEDVRAGMALLRVKCTPSEYRNREKAWAQALAWIRKKEQAGGTPVVSKSFYEHEKGKDKVKNSIRVDVEVKTGPINIVPGGRTDAIIR